MQEKSFHERSRSINFKPTASQQYQYRFPARPPVPRVPWAGLSENTIFYLALIGIIIFLIGAVLSVSAIRTEKRPEREDFE